MESLIGTISQLTLATCMVVTMSFVASTTIGSKGKPGGRARALHIAYAATCAVILMLYPLQRGASVIVDLRAVPILIVAFTYGLWPAALAAVPAMAFRAHLGGPGVISAVAFMALSITVAARFRGRLELSLRSAPRVWWVPLLAVAAGSLASIAVNPDRSANLLPRYLALFAANSLALSLAGSILRSRLELVRLLHDNHELATHDALTGLRNRRQFERDAQDLATGDHLLLIDIDHFKEVNDQLGHQKGDEVLALVARVLSGSTRSRDRCYRLGGEEFAVLLVSCSPEDAVAVAERIRNEVPSAVGQLSEGAVTSLTISGGLVQLRRGDDLWARHASADRLLYRSKEAGRN
ncbi:MAG TPA: diguanylate cyclase [Deinococcales bacterium]|nr:diguanylate cyclase [Deinococcales bacterium]